MSEALMPVDRWLDGAERITANLEDGDPTVMLLTAQLLALGDIFDALRRLAYPEKWIVPPPPEPR